MARRNNGQRCLPQNLEGKAIVQAKPFVSEDVCNVTSGAVTGQLGVKLAVFQDLEALEGYRSV